MTAIDRDRARAAFKSYTDAYDATNPRIALKIEHTYHVAEACDAVAREQGWSSEDIGPGHGFAACYTIWAALSSCDAGTPLRTPRA